MLLFVCGLVFGDGAGVRAAEISLNGHGFTLPDGFGIELVAGPPLVDRPVTADLDEQGRLYVSDSAGVNDPVAKQLEDLPHRILRLTDTDGDGTYDQRTVFADRMMFPEGTLWLDGSLYVSAPPSIWKLTDTDDDGVADRREEWFAGKTVTGCANDLHGPYRGLDGWIYWCKGAFAEQTYELPDGRTWTTKASHIFRCQKDGSGIEPVMTGGMDNPVDVAFTPGGERIFTTTFLQNPGGGHRDGLIHAVYGGVYGKEHPEVLNGHPRTGPALLPVLAHLGPAAPCGLTCYEATTFGSEYEGNLFACLFNLQRVTRHVLVPQGGTFATRDEDFVASNNHDFHPTDIVEDADGSLLVIDTGGWYKLCCPTSQMHKPDVLGAIYRVRRTDAKPAADPRGTRLAWDQLPAGKLVALLDDPRPLVRRGATERLGVLGEAALPALKRRLAVGGSPAGRRHAVWASSHIELPAAREVSRAALADRDPLVRQAAAHVASVWRDSAAQGALAELLAESQPAAVRRAAAEALGRVATDRGVAANALVRAATDSTDWALLHSLTHALAQFPDELAKLTADHPAGVRALLVARDQANLGDLQAADVLPSLASSDPALREAAWWIAGRHGEWGEALVATVEPRVDTELTAEEQTELAEALARLGNAAPVQALLTRLVGESQRRTTGRQLGLTAMTQAGLGETPAEWATALIGVLSQGESSLVPGALAAIRAGRFNPEDTLSVASALQQYAAAAGRTAEDRLAALAVVPGGMASVDEGSFDLLCNKLDPEEPIANRLLAVEVLAHAALTPAQLTHLIVRVQTAGPLELDRLLSAFEPASDAEVGRQLMAALATAPARLSLRPETLRPRFTHFGPEFAAQAEAFYAALTAELAEQYARLDELLAQTPPGDIRRGQAVFKGKKAACAVCHAIGYVGGDIGPDLTRIGQIRNDRDLLESIVFPSASFVRSYEPVTVVTTDGRVFNGLLKQDLGTELLLVTGADQFTRIPEDQIDEMQPGSVSVMPAGLDQQLSPQDLADLVAFLRSCK